MLMTSREHTLSGLSLFQHIEERRRFDKQRERHASGQHLDEGTVW